MKGTPHLSCSYVNPFLYDGSLSKVPTVFAIESIYKELEAKIRT